MLTTDLTERSLVLAERMASLLDHGTELTVLYVFHPDQKIVGDGWTTSINARLQECLGSQSHESMIRFEYLVSTEIARLISGCAKREGADLLSSACTAPKRSPHIVDQKAGFQIVMSTPCLVYSVSS